MTRKFIIGNPFNTEAIIENIKCSNEKFPYFIKKKEGEKLKLIYAMNNEDAVYGLGENTHGINKRGFRYVSFCTDEPSHTEDKNSLYAAHNFLIVEGETNFGMFIDCPQKVEFDVGYLEYAILQITIETEDSSIYFFEEESLKGIVTAFRKTIGESYIPPKWAFGYQQSRWGYQSEDDIRMVARRYRERNIPIDAIYLDIDYMENFKDFTIDRKAFPNFEKLVEEMKNDHIRLVPIIDAGIKIEKGYSLYEEGIEKNYFCTDEKGKPFVAAVWPGKVHFPDFLNPKVRIWFGGKYKFLLDKGIEGFWNDMNEPAIFYSEQGLKRAYEKIDAYKGKDLGNYDFFGLKDSILNISNSEEDYKEMFHEIDGKKKSHYQVHNLFGYNMTKGAAEEFEKSVEKRILLFSRASYIGMHRYGGIWTGDNSSWWQHLLMNIKMMPSLNMCGFLYTGADTGGFAGQVTYDLLVRWIQFSIFTPLFRNHAALGTRAQELYQFDNMKVFKTLLDFRYRLIPYLYSSYVFASKQAEMLFKPLHFEFEEDERTKTVEDQLFYSEALMLAPIYVQNAKGRYLYLPEDMLCVRINKEGKRECAVLRQGHTYIKLELEEFAFFIRENHFIYLAKASESVDTINEEELEIIGFAPEKNELQCKVYNDDGYTKKIDLEKAYTIYVKKTRRGWQASSTNTDIKFNNIFMFT